VVESVALLIFPPVVAVADNCMNKCSDDRTYNVSRMYSVQHVSLSPPELGQSEVFGRRVVSVSGRAALLFPSNEFGQVLLFFDQRFHQLGVMVKMRYRYSSIWTLNFTGGTYRQERKEVPKTRGGIDDGVYQSF
jgi:hypothetical protein